MEVLYMINDVKERYNNSREFQKSILSAKIFPELTEKQEIILKMLYYFDNIFKEDLKNLCFYLMGDFYFDTTLMKLNNEKYIYFERKASGTIYALTRKSMLKFEPYSINQSKVEIKDSLFYTNRVKSSIIANQMNQVITDNIREQFLKRNNNFKEVYIIKEFVKNFMFKDFISKTEGERLEELNRLGITNNKSLLKLKKYGEKSFEIYYDAWKSNYKLLQQDKRYQLFRTRFLEALNTNSNDLKYYLKDFSDSAFDKTWGQVYKAFSDEDESYRDKYILKQFIKHKEYKSFLNQKEGDKIITLLSLGFKREEIKEFLNLGGNDPNKLLVFTEKYFSNGQINKSSLQFFKDHYHKMLQKNETRYHSEYLSNYKDEKFQSIESIIIDYFKDMKNNYLKHSNNKVLISLDKVMSDLKYDIHKINQVKKLEKTRTVFEIFSGYERNIKKVRNELVKKANNELVEEKNNELMELQALLKKFKANINNLENELAFRLLEKEVGEQKERAFTLKSLQDNGIYIEDIKLTGELLYGKELSRITVKAGILDNSEGGLTPHLMFKRIFILQTFLTEIINREGALDLHITFYTLNQNRKQLLENRLPFVQNKMAGFKREFGNLQDKIQIINTETTTIKLWEFYNKIKDDIEKLI